jgi:hypothetical protein
VLQSKLVGFGALGDEVAVIMLSAAAAFTLALALCLRRPADKSRGRQPLGHDPQIEQNGSIEHQFDLMR